MLWCFLLVLVFVIGFIVTLAFSNNTLYNRIKRSKGEGKKLIALKKKQFIIRCFLFLPFVLTVIYCIYVMIFGADFCLLGACSKDYGLKALETLSVLFIYIGWIYIPFIILIIVFEKKYKKELQQKDK